MTDQYNSRKEFIKAANNLWAPFMELTKTWEALSNEDNGETVDHYPFNGSFDEWTYEYGHWLEKITEKFCLQTDEFNPTITVKQLKDILNVLDDDTQIVVYNEAKSWWLNIDQVELPENDGLTLTFYTKNNFETTQF